MAQKVDQIKKNLTRLVFECNVCKKLYDEPGMCQTCDLVLKPRGA